MSRKTLTLVDIIFPISQNKILVLLRDIILVVTFGFLTGLSAKLKIEIGMVPFTFQTFVVLFSAILLGAKRAFFSQFFYLTMGILGVPWFARGGGLSYILSPTLGYLLGFLFSVSLVGYLTESGWTKSIKLFLLSLILGNLIIYFFGVLWLSNFVGFERSLKVGVLPFLLGDFLKIILLVFVFKGLFRITNRI